MSIVDRYGVRANPEMRDRAMTPSDREVERSKSLEMAIRLRRGWPVERVARYFNVHRTTVWRRVKAIPDAAIERAARLVG